MDVQPPVVESTADSLAFLCMDALNDIIDELSIGVCFEIHRSIKLNYFHFEQLFDSPDPRLLKPNVPQQQMDASKPFEYSASATSENSNKLPLCTLPHYDVFGLPLNQKKQIECACPNCKRTVAATRLAPHLEKCMGMGRSSSRLANRRLTQMHSTSTSSLNTNLNSLNSSVEPSILDAFGIGIDFSRNSNSPSSGSEKASALSRNQRVKHRKQGANGNGADSGGKKKKLSVSQQKLFKGALTILDSVASFPEYLSLNAEKRCKVLSGVCGVLETHGDHDTIPNRMCRRSIRCKVHSDNERRDIRSSLLEASSQAMSFTAANPAKKRDTRKDAALEVTSLSGVASDNLNSNSNSDTMDALDMPGIELEEFGSRMGNVFDNLNDWETAVSSDTGTGVSNNRSLGASDSSSNSNLTSNRTCQQQMPVVSFLATKGDLIANSSAQRASNVQSTANSTANSNNGRAKTKSSKSKRRNQKS